MGGGSMWASRRLQLPSGEQAKTNTLCHRPQFFQQMGLGERQIGVLAAVRPWVSAVACECPHSNV